MHTRVFSETSRNLRIPKIPTNKSSTRPSNAEDSVKTLHRIELLVPVAHFTRTTIQNTASGLTITAAALGAQDIRRCRIEGMTQWEIEHLGNSHEVSLVARLRDGELIPCSQKVPIDKAVGMSVAIEDAVVSSGI